MALRPEETIFSETIYEGSVISLRKETVRTGTGRTATREVVHHQPVVVMAPVTAEKDLLMVRQYRKAVDCELLELPAGGVKPGETLEDAVRRELREETGYEPGSMRPLTTILPSPGISDEVMHIFVVTDLSGNGQPTEAAEELQVERINLSHAIHMARTGVITDAKSIIGILMLESAGQHNDSGDSE